MTFYPQKQPYSSIENSTGRTDGPADGPTDGRTRKEKKEKKENMIISKRLGEKERKAGSNR